MDSASEHYDVVIIGGGHNGLVVGCYLARTGLRVVVVEQREWLGGMAAARPFVAEAPDHVLSPGAWENVYFRAGGVGRELNLDTFGYREVESAGWAWLGDHGESLVVQRNVARTVEDIRRFSRRDAQRYAELVKMGVKILKIQDEYGLSHPKRPSMATVGAALKAVSGDKQVRALLSSLLTTTAVDSIDALFESEAVRGIFAGTGSILAPLTVDGSALAVLASSLIHHQGAARPVGAMGGLITALQRCLTAHGGHVRLASEVARIHTDGHCATAVELIDGTVLHAARAVIAACPVQNLPNLVGAAMPARIAERLRHAPANATGLGTFTINAALAGRLELPHHQPLRDDVDLRKPAVYIGTLEEVVTASEQSARGEVPDRAVFCMGIFTAVDPTQAPEGQDVLQLYGPGPVEPHGGWDKWCQEAERRLVDRAEMVYPDLTALEIGRYVETSQDIATRTSAINGCIYHIDNAPTRIGPMRPAVGASGYRTVIDRLYIGSASCHPGGGVSGLPGRHCAAEVLTDLTPGTGLRALLARRMRKQP
ncbi:MAG: NAD(P)/FAD-dependent oxidoreductase [Mycobacterium sp.]|nr:NAD(P)/FAD-dependent oxidoreductase [Mycobacterium sp.]